MSSNLADSQHKNIDIRTISFSLYSIGTYGGVEKPWRSFGRLSVVRLAGPTSTFPTTGMAWDWDEKGEGIGCKRSRKTGIKIDFTLA